MSRRLDINREQVARFLNHEISFFTLSPGEQREAFYELRRRGVTVEQAPDLYRITAAAYQRRLDASNRSGARREIAPAPPGEPQCRGKSELFDLVDGRPQREALALCAACEVTDWCLKTVRPRSSGFSGVAGGRAWSQGREMKVPKGGGRR